MARLFNVETFNQTINGDPVATAAPVFYTNRDHQALFGSADSLVICVIVNGQTANGTLTLTLQSSNTGNEDEWWDTTTSKTFSAGGVNASFIPKSIPWTFSFLSTDVGAFVRFKITYNLASMVTAKIVVCGRAN
jgi:hypothetical protein